MIGVQTVDWIEFVDSPVINTLNPVFWSPDDSITADPGFAVDGDTAWDVRFNSGVGSVFLTADDMAIDGLDAGVALGGDNRQIGPARAGESRLYRRGRELVPAEK